MRKTIISAGQKDATDGVVNEWLDLDRLARVEVTSEAPGCSIEAALVPGAGGGWCAADSGRQLIRLIFDRPQTVSRIALKFTETARARTQEFVIRWSSEVEGVAQELVRQQYNFDPSGATEELEELDVQLADVRMIELEIIPDVSGGDVCACLDFMHIAG